MSARIDHVEHETESSIIRRILDRDRTILGLAAQLGSTVPSTRHDLTMRQLLTLHLLSAQTRPVGEIAAALQITISSASGLVERLVRSGLVSRRHGEADRRIVICEPTDDGREALRDYLEMGRLQLERVLTELSREELVTVEDALEALIRAARAVVGNAGAPSARSPESHAVA